MHLVLKMEETIFGTSFKCIVKIRAGIDKNSCAYKLKQYNSSLILVFFWMILIFSCRLLRGSLVLKLKTCCGWVAGWGWGEVHNENAFISSFFRFLEFIYYRWSTCVFRWRRWTHLLFILFVPREFHCTRFLVLFFSCSSWQTCGLCGRKSVW